MSIRRNPTAPRRKRVQKCHSADRQIKRQRAFFLCWDHGIGCSDVAILHFVIHKDSNRVRGLLGENGRRIDGVHGETEFAPDKSREIAGNDLMVKTFFF